MSPLRRPIAGLGLLALLVTAWLAMRGDISAGDAGLRAAVILVAVRLLDRLSVWWLRQAAHAAAKVSTRGKIVAPHVEVVDEGEEVGS